MHERKIIKKYPEVLVKGKNLLHYRILDKLGAGGQGEVYKALDTKLGRTVVIKVLPAELTVRAEALKRFEREARLASSIDHPNICTIFDLGKADGMNFIVMQYVEGKNVRELVNGRPLELKTVLSIAVQVCDALVAAHGRGIIHRDIKANNVMVTPAGQVKVLDFGLAKLDEESAKTDPLHQTHLTEIGVPYGTATYAAPEQSQGLPADTRADIFSTGVLLYEMLTGKWPFRGKTAIDVRYAVMHDTPQPLSEARPAPVPHRLQEVLDRAMAKEPRNRYQTIADMRDELRGVLHDLSIAGDPNYVPEIPVAAPKHLRRRSAGSHTLDRISAATKLNRPMIAFVGVFFLALLLMPVFLWLSGKPKSTGIVPNDSVILRLHGSNTIGGNLAPVLAEEFFKQQGAKEVRTVPGANLEEATVIGILPGDSSPKAIEIRAHGSATAFTDLLDNKTDIGLASRKIRSEEVQSLAALGDMSSPSGEHVLALDGIAVIVNRNNPIESLTREQIARIFTGEISSWTQVLSPRGQIKVYARDDKSGTYDSFKALVLGNSQLAGAAVRFEDSNALSDAVAQDPDGIGFVGIANIRDAKAVAVSEGTALPLLPNRLTVATEDYILSRRLYLYTPVNSSNIWVRKFLDFALSRNGQDIVARSGFVAQNVEAANPSLAKSAPDEYVKLTNGAERLSVNFRFHKGGKSLDNKAQRDLDRVVDFITDMRLTGQSILLLGFADDGDSNVNSALSKERAKSVAEQFKRRGVTPGVVTGFGSQLPIASSVTEEGKEKNRRVELWLKK